MPPVAPCRREDIMTLLRALRQKAQVKGSNANFTFQTDLTIVERCNKRLRNMTDVGALVALGLSKKSSSHIDKVVFQRTERMPDNPCGDFVDFYKPDPRTGAWAILVALEEMTARSVHDSFHIDQICHPARPHCNVAVKPIYYDNTMMLMTMMLMPAAAAAAATAAD
jgi:hypothetical protein